MAIQAAKEGTAMAGLLDSIQKPNDIKKIAPENYDRLAQEIRDFIISSVSQTGGHLASSLGSVELTMALHLSMDLPRDEIVWDVGHQSYTHKILTGRKEEFETLRTLGGISGFPRRSESECDAFGTGHSSTSISAALGLAAARDRKRGDWMVTAVIGDGAMTGGMAYEALNNVSRLKHRLLIVLNDNNMSISENVGGMSSHLSVLRVQKSYIELKKDVERKLRQIPRVGDGVARSVKKSKDSIRNLVIRNSFFEELGIKYIGPVDGHDIPMMIQIFQAVREMDQPVLVHVVTQKGKGYRPAEKDPSVFHGVGCFDIETGKQKASSGKSYTSVFSDKMVSMAEKHRNIIAISAAMLDGTGLKAFQKRFPHRLYDVGIAEQHAVTFAAGLAAGGEKPFVAIYSSFLQRAFDQIVHDVCIQKLPVVFCIDRAGLVGADGETHQGILDLSYLSMIPNMTVCAPKNGTELEDMLDFAYQFDGPIALRYPRGNAYTGLSDHREPIVCGKSEVISRGSKAAVFAVGGMVKHAEQARQILAENGIEITLVNARFVRPLDTVCLEEMAKTHQLIVTAEDNVLRGGFGEACADYLMKNGYTNDLLHIGVPDTFVTHGAPDLLYRMLGMDAESIAQRILEKLQQEDT